MSIAHRIAVLGFSDFERKTLASYCRLATHRDPHYELVQMCSDGDFVVADADHGASVQLVVATERLPETVFVGTHAPAGAVAWLPRPLDPLHVMRELDRLVAAAVPRAAPAPGSPGVVTVIQPHRRSAAPVPTPAPHERAADAVRDEIDDELRDELLDTRPATFQIQPDIPVPMPAPPAPPPGRASPPARSPKAPARRTPRQPALTKPPPPRPPTLVERAVAGGAQTPAKGAGAPLGAAAPGPPLATPAPESVPAPTPAPSPAPPPAPAPAAAAAPSPAAPSAAAVAPATPPRVARTADPESRPEPTPEAPPSEPDDHSALASSAPGLAPIAPAADAPSAEALSLTLVDVAAAPVAPPAAPQRPADEPTGIVLPPPSALLVDDSEVALRFLQTRLEPWGLQIERATSSRRALEMLAQRDYDFVFLDVELGDDSELDGLALCQHIKRHQGTGAGAALATSVIMVSAHHGQLERVRGTLAGCDAFLGKPLKDAELNRLLQRHGLTRLPVAPHEAIDGP